MVFLDSTLVWVLRLSSVLSFFPGVAGLQGDIQNKAQTPTQQFQSIRREYELAASCKGTTDDDRRKSIARVDSLREGISRKFLELAEKYPSDPIAVDALMQAIWMVNGNSFPSAAPNNPGDKAMALLLRDHVTSEKIGPICLRISSGFRKEYEPFLRTILVKDLHNSARALACLALAQYLNDRSKRIELINREPEFRKDYDARFGAEYVAALRRKDRGRTAREVEALFVRARDEFGDEKIPYEGTVRTKATAELFELHNLIVGKVAAEIEGMDQEGRPFKLSDYRGKVVMLDFWNKY